MRRILLEYLGHKVVDSKAVHHYRQLPLSTGHTKSKRPAKEYFFDSMLFPYNVVGSLIIGHKKISQIIKPYIEPTGERIQTFELYFDKRQKAKRRTRLNAKVFVLKDSFGNYALTDPITDKILLTNQLGLLRTWDVHYPMMEDYFKKTHRYHSQFTVHYLSKSEIKLLNT